MVRDDQCKTNLASDAHHPDELGFVPARGREVCDLLRLTENDQFILDI